MFLRKCTNSKTRRTQLTIVQGYRDTNGKSRQKTVQSLGYLDILEQEYENPIAYFEQVAKQMTEDCKQKTAPIILTINRDDTLDIGANDLKNFGYMILSSLYHKLEIDTFIKNRQMLSNAAFDHNAIFRLLVFARLINPGSKKSTYESKHLFFDRTAFELEDVYRSLAFFAKYKEDLQLWIHEKIQKLWRRDTSQVYFDVTNYYFEIDQADELRKKGVSKEHRPDPIVQMGLLIDNNGIPISYRLFPGNTPDMKTLQPVMRRLQEKYSLGRTIYVADRGLVWGNNIAQILADKNGYVLSYSIRKADSKFKAYALRDYDYRATSEKADKLWEVYKNHPPKPGSPHILPEDLVDIEEFRIKTRLSPRTITVTTKDGKQTKVTVHEKQIIYYSPVYAQKAKADRAKAVAKARDMVKNPGRYTQTTAKGATKYVKNISFNPKTGEIHEDVKNHLSFDEDKLKEEEKYDGYYAIVSSEMNESTAKILDTYKGLWEIEESFKFTKRGISSRPVYVSKKDHIEAHFLTCFISLLLSRLLQKQMNNKYGIETMLESLRKATCGSVEENLYIFHYYDEILKEIGEAFNIDFSLKYRTLEEIKKVLSESRK